jgi:hypothetical protein
VRSKGQIHILDCFVAFILVLSSMYLSMNFLYIVSESTAEALERGEKQAKALLISDNLINNPGTLVQVRNGTVMQRVIDSNKINSLEHEGYGIVIRKLDGKSLLNKTLDGEKIVIRRLVFIDKIEPENEAVLEVELAW